MQGTVIRDGFKSIYMPGTNDINGKRYFNIYLPSGYYENPNETYPVVYHLGGYGSDYDTYLSTPSYGSDAEMMNALLNLCQILPMIIVTPDPNSILSGYGGCYYVNSTANGYFEDYFIKELIPYINKNYRQKKDINGNSAPFRAIMGQSMGGFGALYYGLKYPNYFSTFAADTPTALWLFIPNPTTKLPLAGPLNYPEFTISKATNLTNVSPCNTNDLQFIQVGSAAFSPACTTTTYCPSITNDCNYSAVNFPINTDANLNTLYPNGQIIESFPSCPSAENPAYQFNYNVVKEWQNFNLYYYIEQNKNNEEFIKQLKNQTFLINAGYAVNDPQADDFVNNAGAKIISDLLISLNINHERILYNYYGTSSAHAAYLNYYNIPFKKNNYRFITDILMFSSKFSEAGCNTNDQKIKIAGNGSFIIQNGGSININNKSIVAIETDPESNIDETNFKIILGNNGSFILGEKDGGALQIGNNFGKAILINNPSYVNNSINFELSLIGFNCQFIIKEQSFLGFATGLIGYQPSKSNYWGASTLNNVNKITLNILNGIFKHNQIASGLNEKSSLIALGDSGSGLTKYNFSFNPKYAKIISGGNLSKVLDSFFINLTSQNKTGIVAQAGLTNKLNTDSTVYDYFYTNCGYPTKIESHIYYTNQLDVSILSTIGLSSSKQNIYNYNVNDFFNYLKSQDYYNQDIKTAPINLEDNKIAILTPNKDNKQNSNINRININNLNDNIKQESGVGVKIVNIDNKEFILSIYDQNPPF